MRLVLAATILVVSSISTLADDLTQEALKTAQRATQFLTESVSTEGGYLWAYSHDLSQKEGEGAVKTQTVWVQPPGTPSLGEVFVHLYQATGDKQFLNAARSAAEALRRGQMQSGGWQSSIEFEPDRRKRWAYRTNAVSSKAKDQSSLDDDKSQSALRFLMQLDQATEFGDQAIHEMTLYGLESLISKGQFRNGGFPQVWTGQRHHQANAEPRKASFPSQWPREYPGHQRYSEQFTLNDHLARDVMSVLLLAADIYKEDGFSAAASRLGNALLLAQMPEPQPAWAQQYNAEMQPIWARKFEPPAITSAESQSVIETLMLIYAYTGDERYLEPIPRALEYLESSRLPDGRLARFYELKTNRPLYFDRQYKLTYSDQDLPTHYGFQLDSKLEKLRSRFAKVSELSREKAWDYLHRASEPSDKHIRSIIQSTDANGIWLTDKPLRYANHPGPVIDMKVIAKNLNALAAFLNKSASKQ